MPPPDPQRLQDLFDDALDLRPDRRVAFVRAAAADDPELVAELVDLLEVHDGLDDFLEPAHAGDAERGPMRTLLDDAWTRFGVGAVELPQLEGFLVGDRYRLGERLGRGGFGVVHAATDLATGDDVAVKLTRSGVRADRVASRELAALLLLGDPVVVRWLDDGVDGGVRYVVAERVRGLPFPGVERPAPWSVVEPVVDRLLATLSRVHALDLVHGDLKPPNVLVEADGRVVLLDFGLARGRALDHVRDRGVRAGTRAFMAPELLASPPAAGGPSADLYAVALMTVQALTGRVPHATEGTDPTELVRRRASEPFDAACLSELPVPPEVVATLTRMLAHDPTARPATAAEARRGLRSAGSVDTAFGAFVAAAMRPAQASGRGMTDAELRALFAGPDLILHLREDAAALVMGRTNGDPARIADELTRWCEQGYARFDSGLLRASRTDLDRLELAHAMGTEGSPEHAVLSDMESGRIGSAVRRAVERAEELERTGFAGRALALVTAVLPALRDLVGVEAEERQLLVTLLELAQAVSDVRETEIVRAHLERGTCDDAEYLAALGRATLMALSGDSRRALAAAGALGPGSRADVMLIWQSLRGFVSRREGSANRSDIVREIEEWAALSSDVRARRLALSERAWSDYRCGEFQSATRLHREAATYACGARLQVNSLLAAAESAQWSFDLATVRECLTDVTPLLLVSRLPTDEVRVAALVHQLAYIEERAEAPDDEWIAAVRAFDDNSSTRRLLLTQAAISWRLGELDLARQLALDWTRAWLSPEGVGARLGRALAAASGSGASAESMRADADASLTARPPGVALQTLALLARAGLHVTVSDREAARALAADLPRHASSIRREVLSTDEALRMLGSEGFPRTRVGPGGPASCAFVGTRAAWGRRFSRRSRDAAIDYGSGSGGGVRHRLGARFDATGDGRHERQRGTAPLARIGRG